MKNTVIVLFVSLGCFAAIALADSRPVEPRLTQELNGEVSRERNARLPDGGAGILPDGGYWAHSVFLADGGGLSLYTTDAGIACNYLTTGAVYEMHCSAAFYFCPWGDGSCSSSPESAAYGPPHLASTISAPAPFRFLVTSNTTANSTKLVCALPSGAATLLCAPFRLR